MSIIDSVSVFGYYKWTKFDSRDNLVTEISTILCNEAISDHGYRKSPWPFINRIIRVLFNAGSRPNYYYSLAGGRCENT